MGIWKFYFSMVDSSHQSLQQSKTLTSMNEEAIMVMLGASNYLQLCKAYGTSPPGGKMIIPALMWVLVEEHIKDFVSLGAILANWMWALPLLGCLAPILSAVE
jgi:hypothetical protein